MIKYTVVQSARFRQDLKRIRKRQYNVSLMNDVVTLLQAGEPLPEKHHDHALTGDYAGHRECHITPDWLLVYKIQDDILILTLTRTGTHSDLF
jgi:mRNA interferase YafQ